MCIAGRTSGAPGTNRKPISGRDQPHRARDLRNELHCKTGSTKKSKLHGGEFPNDSPLWTRGLSPPPQSSSAVASLARVYPSLSGGRGSAEIGARSQRHGPAPPPVHPEGKEERMARLGNYSCKHLPDDEVLARARESSVRRCEGGVPPGRTAGGRSRSAAARPAEAHACSEDVDSDPPRFADVHEVLRVNLSEGGRCLFAGPTLHLECCIQLVACPCWGAWPSSAAGIGGRRTGVGRRLGARRWHRMSFRAPPSCLSPFKRLHHSHAIVVACPRPRLKDEKLEQSSLSGKRRSAAAGGSDALWL